MDTLAITRATANTHSEGRVSWQNLTPLATKYKGKISNVRTTLSTFVTAEKCH